MKRAARIAFDSQGDTDSKRWYVLILLTAVYALNIADRLAARVLVGVGEAGGISDYFPWRRRAYKIHGEDASVQAATFSGEALMNQGI